jgi:DNA-binding transcriptional ArsR family regulator
MEANVFAALADPTRRDVLMRLADEGPKTGTHLAEHYAMSRQGLIKHMRILKAAGLVSVSQRGRDKQYVLSPRPLNELDAWITALNAKWDARLSRLKALVESANDD